MKAAAEKNLLTVKDTWSFFYVFLELLFFCTYLFLEILLFIDIITISHK